MLLIRANTAVADVYLTEFMRLFTHYEFRHVLTKPRPTPAQPPPRPPSAAKPSPHVRPSP